jgi:putative PIN family toxin of toxin-antitoxin system
VEKINLIGQLSPHLRSLSKAVHGCNRVKSMKTYQIVLDTNVLLAGLRSRRGASYKLLTILNDNRWQLNISTALVFEYEEILKREQTQLGLSLEDIDNVIDALCAIANKRSIFYLWRPMLNDPNDDFLVDLAVESQADYIITYNQKDLQPAEKFGLLVVTPKQFLQAMGEIA